MERAQIRCFAEVFEDDGGAGGWQGGVRAPSMKGSWGGLNWAVAEL